MRAPRHGRRWIGVLEAITSVAAIGGGVGLMINGLGLPADKAPDLPIGSGWMLPGVALIAVVGGGQAVASIAELRNHERAAQATLVAGSLLVAMEVAELALIEFSWLTPAYLGLGLVEVGSGFVRLWPSLSPDQLRDRRSLS